MKKFIKNHAGALVSWAVMIAIIAVDVIAIIIAMPHCSVRSGIVNQKYLIPIAEQGHRVEVTKGVVTRVEEVVVYTRVKHKIYWSDQDGELYCWTCSDKDEGESYHKGDTLWYWEEYYD